MKGSLFKILKSIYPSFVWEMETNEKEIYLTFDDGPIPELTGFVLDCLKEYKAKATFFCVGENIERHNDIFKRTINEGHAIGNHTHTHVNGWKTGLKSYLENFESCQNVINKDIETTLFRPPYGRIKRRQANKVLEKSRIIMWSVLTKDYDVKLEPKDCLKMAINQTRPGSIVLFHDNIKAKSNLMYALPRFLEHFSGLGYEFKRIE